MFLFVSDSQPATKTNHNSILACLTRFGTALRTAGKVCRNVRATLPGAVRKKDLSPSSAEKQSKAACNGVPQGWWDEDPMRPHFYVVGTSN